MNKFDWIQALYPKETFTRIEGFDDAIIGLDYEEMRLVYSVGLALEILQKTMSRLDACKHFHNVLSKTKYPKRQPIWIDDDFPFEL